MISRRKFLIVAGSAAGATLIGSTQLEKVLASASASESGSSGNSEHLWGMVIDAEKCTECMNKLIEETGLSSPKPPCETACDKENNVPEFENKEIDPQWLKMIWVKNELEGERIWIPIICNQCRNPACEEVCPTKATFKRDDGIVMIDYHRCIGCRYCMVACPYNARSFNFKDPLEGLDSINPDTPTRGEGVVEKCHFCVHRIDAALKQGKEPLPACVEACQAKAKELGFDGPSLVFGDLKDPNSEVVKIIQTERTNRLRESLGTEPKVYYTNF